MNTALVIIDVQNGLFGGSPPPFEADTVIARINRLADSARRVGFPVIFMQHDGKAEENVLPFSEGWRLHGELKVNPGDLVIRKTTCDAFFETPLESELDARGITRVMLAGYATEFCVDSTLRNACSDGFEVFVAADAHTTHDNPVLKARQVIEHHNWAWANTTARPPINVLTTEELIERVMS